MGEAQRIQQPDDILVAREVLADWCAEAGTLARVRTASGMLERASDQLLIVACEAARRQGNPVPAGLYAQAWLKDWPLYPRLVPGYLFTNVLVPARGRARERKLSRENVEQAVELHVEALFLAARFGIDPKRVYTRLGARCQLRRMTDLGIDDSWSHCRGKYDVLLLDGLWGNAFRCAAASTMQTITLQEVAWVGQVVSWQVVSWRAPLADELIKHTEPSLEWTPYPNRLHRLLTPRTRFRFE